MKKLKLIWDFKSREVEEYAKHHAKHLREYVDSIDYGIKESGYEIVNEYHAIAYLIILEKDMIKFRDLLKPHRAEYYRT